MAGVPIHAAAVRERRHQVTGAQSRGAGVVRKVANAVGQLLPLLSPTAALLTAGVVADLAVGDPVYAWHPVRLIGRTLTSIETRLRRIGLDGYGGGIVLFIGLAATSLTVLAVLMTAAQSVSESVTWV